MPELNRDNEHHMKFVPLLHSFNLSPSAYGNAFAYVIQYPGKPDLTLEKRSYRPCYGELRRYSSGKNASENCTRPQDPWPSDLPKAMKDGDRFAVALPFRSHPSVLRKYSEDIGMHNEFIYFVFGPESPWRKGLALDFLEYTKDDSGAIVGIVQTSGQFDATTFVSLCMNHRYWPSGIGDLWKERIESGMSKQEALLSTFFVGKREGKSIFLRGPNGYSMSPNLSIKRFHTGDVRDLSSGKTWGEGDDYNRPEVQDLFSPSGKMLVLFQRLRNKASEAGLEFALNYSGAVLKGTEDNYRKVLEIFHQIYESALNEGE